MDPIVCASDSNEFANWLKTYSKKIANDPSCKSPNEKSFAAGQAYALEQLADSIETGIIKLEGWKNKE